MSWQGCAKRTTDAWTRGAAVRCVYESDPQAARRYAAVYNQGPLGRGRSRHLRLGADAAGASEGGIGSLAAAVVILPVDSAEPESGPPWASCLFPSRCGMARV